MVLNTLIVRVLGHKPLFINDAGEHSAGYSKKPRVA